MKDGPQNEIQVRMGTALFRSLWLVQSFIQMICGYDVWESQAVGILVSGCGL